MLGSEFSLVDCAYGPVIDALELSGDTILAYPALRSYVARMRERGSWRACGFR
jgi:glutathione S-transferase